MIKAMYLYEYIFEIQKEVLNIAISIFNTSLWSPGRCGEGNILILKFECAVQLSTVHVW